MAHTHRPPGRARHRRRASARLLRSRYTVSWLVILICLDVFFLQGMVSSIHYENSAVDARERTGESTTRPGQGAPGHGHPSRPHGGAAPVPSPTATRPPGTRPPAGRPPPGTQPGQTAPRPSTPVRSGVAHYTQRYQLACGVVTLVLTQRAARLVSVTPRTGWKGRSWSGDGWLRIELAGRARQCVLVANWRGHRPRVSYSNGR
jgi:hypothetical protein